MELKQNFNDFLEKGSLNKNVYKYVTKCRPNNDMQFDLKKFSMRLIFNEKQEQIMSDFMKCDICSLISFANVEFVSTTIKF